MASAASSADIVGQVVSIHLLRNQVFGHSEDDFRQRLVAGVQSGLGFSRVRLRGFGSDRGDALLGCLRAFRP